MVWLGEPISVFYCCIQKIATQHICVVFYATTAIRILFGYLSFAVAPFPGHSRDSADYTLTGTISGATFSDNLGVFEIVVPHGCNKQATDIEAGH